MYVAKMEWYSTYHVTSRYVVLWLGSVVGM